MEEKGQSEAARTAGNVYVCVCVLSVFVCRRLRLWAVKHFPAANAFTPYTQAQQGRSAAVN